MFAFACSKVEQSWALKRFWIQTQSSTADVSKSQRRLTVLLPKDAGKKHVVQALSFQHVAVVNMPWMQHQVHSSSRCPGGFKVRPGPRNFAKTHSIPIYSQYGHTRSLNLIQELYTDSPTTPCITHKPRPPKVGKIMAQNL